jgi:hypothetical protein
MVMPILGTCFIPKAKMGAVIFIDSPDWRVGKALDDLAYMLALGYFPEQKKKIETDLIKLLNSVLNEKSTTINHPQKNYVVYREHISWHCPPQYW